ncbi:MAG: hypothetical protein K8R53_09455 [Bacteroidales bacterium]|nr:hypothetical protein [Bacteroidales bacterium]
MKKISLSVLIILLGTTLLFAQGPEAFNYQTIVMDGSGNQVVNQAIAFRISIINSSPSGSVEYQETHLATTNQFGLASLSVGNGNPVSGLFTSIDWGKESKFIKIEVDLSGGSAYLLMGTSQLLNVPYSIFANSSAGSIVMTSAERETISNPPMGMQIFNSDSRKINYFDGYGWLEITGVKQADFTCGNPVLDSRDGTYYTTVEIGSVCWMAENINVGIMIQGLDNQADNGIIEKYCYHNTQNLCDNTYGGLYQWREMMQYTSSEGIKGICIEGWHLPSDSEWTTLVNATGGPGNAGTNLVQGGSSGFEALMGGQRNLYSGYPFGGVGSYGYFWTSTQVNSSIAYDRYLQNGNPAVFTEQLDKNYGLSVRCVKD